MRLTDIIVKRLPAPSGGNKVIYDETVKGFGVRVTRAGARAFVLNYRRKSDGRERRYTIGSYPDWGAAAAREEAKRLKREIDGGADPIGELEISRGAPTVIDLCTRFLEDHLPRVRPARGATYHQQVSIDILPALGRMKVAAVSHADVDAFHRKISARAPTMPTARWRASRRCSRCRCVGVGAAITRARVSSATRRASGTAT